MKKVIIGLLLMTTTLTFFVQAEDDHDHKEGKEEKEESNSSVGPNKGILSADEKKGFRLSEAAIKKFNYSLVKIQGSSPWKIPSSSVVKSKDEKNLYRVRGQFIKRIDFKLMKSEGDNIVIASNELNEGDSVISTNVGFIRIAEITAFGGNEEGHSH